MDAKKLTQEGRELLTSMFAKLDPVLSALGTPKAAEAPGVKARGADSYERPSREVRTSIEGASPQQNEAAEAVADHLFHAMEGGLWGFGIDSRELFNALDGIGPKELSLVRAHYKNRTGDDLDRVVRGQLRGKKLERASALLQGEAVRADALALVQSLQGLRKDLHVAFQVLERAAQTKRAGTLLEELWDWKGLRAKDIVARFPAGDRPRASALLEGDVIGAKARQVERLLEQEESYVRDAVLMRLLEDGGAELARLLPGLAEALENQLPRLFVAQAAAALKGDAVATATAGLRRVLSGTTGFDPVEQAESLLARTSVEVRREIVAGYDAGESRLDADLAGLTPADRAAMRELLETGKRSMLSRIGAARGDARRLVALLSEVGTDLDALRGPYFKRFGVPMASLPEAFEGLDRLRVEQALRGPPSGVEDAVARLKEQRDFLRSGVVNLSSRLVLDYALFSKVKRIDETVSRAEAALAAALEDGRITPAESAEITALVSYGSSDVDSYWDAVQRIARVSKGLAATIVAGSALSATAGTGVLLPFAAAVTASLATTPAVGAVMEGTSYSMAKAKRDAIEGAAIGASLFAGNVIANGISDQGARMFGEWFDGWVKMPPQVTMGSVELDSVHRLAAEFILNSQDSWRALYQVSFGTVRAATGFAAGNLVRGVFDEKTWAKGTGAGLKLLMQDAVEGLRSGALNGSMAALVSLAFGGIHHVSLQPADRANELLHNLEISTPDGPQAVQLIGPASPEHVEELKRSLQQLSSLTNGETVKGLEYVVALNYDPTSFMGLSYGDNGIALNLHDTSTMVMPDGTSHVSDLVNHEAFHHVGNARLGELSDAIGRPPFAVDPGHGYETETRSKVEDAAIQFGAAIQELLTTGTISLDGELGAKTQEVLRVAAPSLLEKISRQS